MDERHVSFHVFRFVGLPTRYSDGRVDDGDDGDGSATYLYAGVAPPGQRDRTDRARGEYGLQHFGEGAPRPIIATSRSRRSCCRYRE